MNKRTSLLVIGIALLAGVIGVSLLVLHNNDHPSHDTAVVADYEPTTFAKVQQAGSASQCQQVHDNAELTVDAQQKTQIENVIASSIIDVPAGTNVDVHLKTYSSNTATGTSVYSGKYGSYNFTVSKVTSETGNTYTGGWKVIKLVACQPA